MLRSKGFILSLLLFCLSTKAKAQELYVFTEPASNMPTKSFGFRLNNEFVPKATNQPFQYRFNPEVMWGLDKNWMLHFNLFAANYHGKFHFEGTSVYVKYRFLTLDKVHAHFRMAAYARGAVVNNPIQTHEINLSGDNTGFGTGIVMTQLVHKIAFSATGGYLRSGNNWQDVVPKNYPRDAINYSLSVGYLLLPIKYKSYNQPNLNVLLELLGKSNPATKESFLYIAPALQLILHSVLRIDIGYRKQLIGNMSRNNTQEFLLRFEYNLFNAYK